MICMALSVWFVHSLGDPNKCASVSDRARRGSIITADRSSPIGSDVEAPVGDGNSDKAAIVFVAIFVVFMVFFTFLLVFLYKRGCTKVIAAWLIIAVFMIYAYVGGVYIFEFCRSRCIALDWITLAFAVWNFTVTGLIAVFGTVPRLVNQAYLIVMSSLMAYIFRILPEWGTWTILGILVVWDLFAVLAPCGPLKMLVEAARERGDPLPALVYDTNPNDVGRDASAQPAVVLPVKPKPSSSPSATTNPILESNAHAPEAVTSDEEPVRRFGRKRKAKPAHVAVTDVETSARTPPARDAVPRETVEDDEIRVGTLGSHLKLGLGDFVFYSVLVAQASQGGAMTAITSFIAILAGLCTTLFLVTVYRKALPALPISITAGLLFYVLTRYTMQPFVENLLPELIFH